MAGHDIVGCCVFETCKLLDLNVPDDVSLVSVNNDEMLCEMVKLGLTSIDRHEEQIGFKAAELLDHLMKGDNVRSHNIRVTPGRLVQRQSSDVLSVPDIEVAAAIRFIRNRAAESISVSDVLRQVPISRRVLEVRFRKTAGRTIGAEIRRAHIRLAKELLNSTELTVSEIARRTGFNYDSQFRPAFKKETGMAPRATRKQPEAGRRIGRGCSSIEEVESRSFPMTCLNKAALALTPRLFE